MVDQSNNESSEGFSIQPIKEGAAKSQLGKDELAEALPQDDQSLQPRKEDLADVEPGQPGRKDDSEKNKQSGKDDNAEKNQ